MLNVNHKKTSNKMEYLIDFNNNFADINQYKLTTDNDKNDRIKKYADLQHNLYEDKYNLLKSI